MTLLMIQKLKKIKSPQTSDTLHYVIQLREQWVLAVTRNNKYSLLKIAIDRLFQILPAII